MDSVQLLPTVNIFEAPIILRVVDTGNTDYLEMRDSIQEHGLFSSICVRPAPNRGPNMYEVVDGLYRFSCHRDLKIKEIPCIIKEVDDHTLLSIQIQANAIRPETTRMEYARQLRKILDSDTDYTLTDIALMVHKSVFWVSRMLGLLNLSSDIQRCVDRGEIGLGNAYWLTQMHKSYRDSYVESAIMLSGIEFRLLARDRIKAFREAVKKGSLESFYATMYSPTPHLRALKELEIERTSLKAAGEILATNGCKTPMDGWRMALTWVVHMDAGTVADIQAAHERRLGFIEHRKTRRLESIRRQHKNSGTKFERNA